ncbi:MAG: aromatic ring-hydroxylating oxygenase subunit alpha [Solirubrobacterales bacterium]
MTDQQSPVVREENGTFLVSRRAYFDQGVFDRELRNIFGRAWLFLGHESEIVEPGDYVTRRLGADPVIVVRDEEGQVNVLANTCRHRGIALCRADRGNTSHFRCPYHGWTYTNQGNLIGVTAMADMYGSDFDKSRFSLYRAARVDTFHGLIFATWDPDAPPLLEYLGDAAWYLESVFGGFDGGVEVLGSPIRTRMRFNWKPESENLGGDGYHTPITHQSAFFLGFFAKEDDWEQLGEVVSKSYKGRVVAAGGGHTFRVHHLPVATEKPAFFGYPDELWPQMTRNLDPGQVDVQARLSVLHGNVFPNLTVLNNFKIATDKEGSATRYIRLTQGYPIAPNVNEMLWWGFTPKGADSEWRGQTQRANLRTVGPAGLFQIDDDENYAGFRDAHSGAEIVGEDLTFEGGLDNELATDVDWRGTVYDADKSEHTMRSFWRTWSEYVEGGDREPTEASG